MVPALRSLGLPERAKVRTENSYNVRRVKPSLLGTALKVWSKPGPLGSGLEKMRKGEGEGYSGGENSGRR